MRMFRMPTIIYKGLFNVNMDPGDQRRYDIWMPNIKLASGIVVVTLFLFWGMVGGNFFSAPYSPPSDNYWYGKHNPVDRSMNWLVKKFIDTKPPYSTK